MFLEKKPSVYLYEAGQLLAKGWCKNALALRHEGPATILRTCWPLDPRATHWCMFGALLAVGVPIRHDETHVVEHYLRSVLSEFELSSHVDPDELIETVNDSPIWNQVKAVKAFEAACKLALENGE